MKVQLVSLEQSAAAKTAGVPVLSTELLASVAARYSRNDEGLMAILSTVDPENPEASIDRIFAHVDFGHRSITDISVAAVFIDGLSLDLAYRIWAEVATCGGQETSTRYVRIKPEGLIDPAILGIDPSLHEDFLAHAQDSFSTYTQVTQFWEDLAQQRPETMRLPASVLADTSQAGLLKLKRMRRNFVFDRSRYWLPTGCATNMALIMPGRAWVDLLQWASSHILPEARLFAELAREQLALEIPRCLKHAVAQPSMVELIEGEFFEDVKAAHALGTNQLGYRQPEAYLDIHLPRGVGERELHDALLGRRHRYDRCGRAVRRTSVRYGWTAVALAEIRDLNRHRPGSKYCPMVPQGFYGAQDQCPDDLLAAYEHFVGEGQRLAAYALRQLLIEDPSYSYWANLGTQYPFEHTTTLNMAVYTWELRTGLGAHFRYARHVRQVLALLYERFPSLHGVVHEGLAEPE